MSRAIKTICLFLSKALVFLHCLFLERYVFDVLLFLCLVVSWKYEHGGRLFFLCPL